MQRSVTIAVLVAGLTITGIPASSAAAAFSANPHAGKLKALISTAAPWSGSRTCCPQKRDERPSLTPSPSRIGPPLPSSAARYE